MYFDKVTRTIVFEDNDPFEVIKFKSHEEWVEGRLIGGSSSSACCGRNPYMTNVELAEILLGHKERKDISNAPYVVYGQNAEAPLRDLFGLHYIDDYEVIAPPTLEKEGYLITLRSKKYNWMTYTPDGWLVDKKTNEILIYEGKTTTILNSQARENWKGKVPINYYTQVLHGLVVTGLKGAIINAEKRYKLPNETQYFITDAYYIEHDEMESKWLILEEYKFWKHIKNNQIPPLIIYKGGFD